MKIVLLILISTIFAFNANAQNNVDSAIAERIPSGVQVKFLIKKIAFSDKTRKNFGVTISYYVKKKDSWDLVNYSNNNIMADVNHPFVKCLIWEDTEIKDVRISLWSAELNIPNNFTRIEATAVRVVEKI